MTVCSQFGYPEVDPICNGTKARTTFIFVSMTTTVDHIYETSPYWVWKINWIAKLNVFELIPQLQVYFGSFEVTTIVETPHWTWETILTGLGGALSLWLGITLAGILEFFELFCRLLAAVFSEIVPAKNWNDLNNDMPSFNKLTLYSKSFLIKLPTS